MIANRSPRTGACGAPAAPGGRLSAAQGCAVVKMVGELGEGVELALTPGLAAQDPERALDLALELPERVAQARRKRLILSSTSSRSSPRAPPIRRSGCGH